MIKINLLPTTRKPPRKVTELQKQLIIAVMVTGGAVAAMAFYTIALNARISAREKEKAAATAEVARQDNLLKEVKNVEEERRKVTEKIGVIEQLKKNQQGPVRLLDEVSRAIPNTVDLTSLTEAGGNISLTGEAFTNEDIVRFVDHLKASPYFAEVYLLESSQKPKEGYEIYEYKLQFRYKGL